MIRVRYDPDGAQLVIADEAGRPMCYVGEPTAEDISYWVSEAARLKQQRSRP